MGDSPLLPRDADGSDAAAEAAAPMAQRPAPVDAATDSPRPATRSAATGFLTVVAAAFLVVGGLWGIARQAPSAEPAPTPLPTPTPAQLRDRFGLPAFPTARAAIIRHPAVRSGIANARPTPTPVPPSLPGFGPRRMRNRRTVAGAGGGLGGARRSRSVRSRGAAAGRRLARGRARGA